MDPDDPFPPLSIGDFRVMEPLYIDTTDVCVEKSYQPNNNASVHAQMDGPPLLSAVIGNSLRCLDTGNIVVLDMPELLPLSQQKPTLPTDDRVVRMPCLSPNHSNRRRREKSSNPYSQCFLATGLQAQQEHGLHQVSWLQKETEPGPRVIGKLREKMMSFVKHDDLDTQRAEAVENIQRRMVKKTGTAAPKALIEKLLYSLKRKRREAFKKQNDEMFEGLNWDFSSPALKTYVSDVDDDDDV